MTENNSKAVLTKQAAKSAEDYMQRCLFLARQGEGHVAPNPMVGALIVYNNEIIGEGYHHKYGQAHAEPNAIKSVKKAELLQHSTLYVNLEPCSHYGKTPPCANLIVSCGIKRVVIGTLDPNPKVSGRGIKILQAAGIEVVVGVLENECRELNKRFFTFQLGKRPYILLKWAQTRDGFIDKARKDNTEMPLQISNTMTRQLTHKMRSENQSIMVSTNTVLLDNPTLTVRNWAGRNPIRIAIDRTLKVPDHYNILDGKVQTILFTETDNSSKTNIEYVKIDFDNNSLQSILNELFKRNINSVLVEGGAQLLQNFINEGLWDEANIEVSEQMINEGVPAPTINCQPCKTAIFHRHLWLNYQNNNKKFV